MVIVYNKKDKKLNSFTPIQINSEIIRDHDKKNKPVKNRNQQKMNTTAVK